ncbi:adenylosuccinate lyase [Psittacicella melopsittaci]|uniref:Adenylosuccinate lyase n=1 Tax=Psittacicella melopsittaci TaxID=2028576 RepID=A0A3A1Y2D9_9GAMM|nr:adenylosuccinate lyase [Psittacicella melopsittaci]RIY31601.1 adenylosuccinate lyase [Psittacicella melopsittaci]
MTYSSFDPQSATNFYDYPLCSRYASEKMKHIFSPNFKFSTWRKLWVILAESEKELGLDFISEEQIQQLRDNIYNIDFAKAHQYEIELKHDVMAHVHAYGDVAPEARKIIHLGVTSAYVGDNTDLIQMREGLLLVKQRLVTLIATLAKFAQEHKDLPTLGYTHFQAAQLTTVGKRATLWLKSFMFDLEQIEHCLEHLEFRGVKGTTGTAASFKELFGNDYSKVVALDQMVTEKAGFKRRQEVSGQTYDRKQDTFVLQVLAGFASSAHKFTNDFRLLQHLKELEEPFGKKQIGSSAMAYKRNPMRCERISALAKFVLSLEMNGHLVHATQWFERTLDDSANKRLSYPQAFLAVDAILLVLQNIAEGIVVYEKMITRNVMRELPFMATEDIIMDCVKKGMDRQEVHEVIRELSMEQARLVKQEGQENRLIEAIIADGRLPISASEIKDLLNPSNYIGFAPQQVDDYLTNVIQPMLARNQEFILGEQVEFTV